MNYPFDLGGWATLDVRYQHTVQLEAATQLFRTSEYIDRVGRFGSPEHVGNFTVGLYRNDWALNWTARYIGEVSEVSRIGGVESTLWGEDVILKADADAVVYHSLSFGKDFGSDMSVTVGVANLLDEEPPKVSAGAGISRVGNAAFYSQYDLLGRRAFVNLQYSF